MTQSFRLVIACPDQIGLVAAVTEFVAMRQGMIIENNNYSDPVSGWFFMRLDLQVNNDNYSLNTMSSEFLPLAQRFNMKWRLTDANSKKRVVIMASKQEHCLKDLLYRWQSHDLDFELCCVIDNHDDFRGYVEWYKVPYHHLPVPSEDEGKQAAFKQLAELFEHYQPDLIILARYMQILPDWLCHDYAGRVINIHHSFLPSFAGAKPYHQAQQRGVKLIGATCHYVTEDLDEGPIIEQDVARIGHRHTVEDLVRLGKDVERNVLARGVRYHLQDRIVIHGNKTVVFD